MQSPPSIFNFLLVALVVLSIEAAPHSDVQDSSEGWKPTPNVGNAGEDLTRSIGPEILHPQSEKPIENADLIHFPSTTTKTRRMVYGWSPKGFDGDNDDESSNHSDLSLMAADSPETSEHKSKVITKQSAPSGPTKPKAGPKAAPPAEVLKALCRSLLSGESGTSSDKSSGALHSPAGKESAGKGNSSTSWSPKSPALEKTPGMATEPKLSPNATGSALSGGPVEDGDKYSAAMSWCHQFMNYSSSDTGASHGSSNVGPKPSVHANGTALPPSSPVEPSASGSKNDSKLSDPAKIEDSKSSDDQGVAEDKSGKEKNPKAPTNFKVPSNQVPSS